ncbi:MAG: hypothetical protein IJ516_06080 [Phascolarctobacterium sp.]|nr:hypothetical protein [Phascolarctobacterium sp.]
MTMDERQRNFKVAKQEAQQHQTAEKQEEKSETDELNIKHVMDVLANQQLADIMKAVEKLGKQNEILQKKYAEGLQLNLQNYLDTHVVDATAKILKQHCEKIENIQSYNAFYIQKINEKLEILLGLVGMTFVAVTGFAIYRYLMR